MKVLIILGSDSDLPSMDGAKKILQQFKVPYDLVVASAHRKPKQVAQIASSADMKYDVIIAGAGMAAALPGVVASHTILPVIGIPLEGKHLDSMDALLSIVQMPPGVPVATVAIGGAKNAAILAVQIMAGKYPKLKVALKSLKHKMAKGVKV
jgi:5-(carboxyamino)imidazole ribonucleotide mutase